MRTERFRKARKGRFSILHAFPCTRKTYSLLLKAMHPHFCCLGSVFLFLPERKRKVRAILEGLGFSVERYSSLMENRDPADPEVRFPRGFTVRPLDVSDWDGIRRFARCVNVNFRETAGHIDSSPDDIRRMFHEPGYLKEGICMLWKEREAVGTVCISREPETAGTAEIGGLSVDPRFREQGLGRMLLRYARRMAHASGLPAVVLSVNAENELAFRLYRSEGFLPLQTMVCYTLMCGKRAE
jgi:ribosomal protein S18 acetylase RimI-like enzyme